jgi:hypothetical protein
MVELSSDEEPLISSPLIPTEHQTSSFESNSPSCLRSPPRNQNKRNRDPEGKKMEARGREEEFTKR